MSEGHKRYSTADRTPVPGMRRVVGTATVGSVEGNISSSPGDTSSFIRRVQATVADQTRHQPAQYAGGERTDSPEAYRVRLAEYERRIATQEGTPLAEVFSQRDTQTCHDFLAYMSGKPFSWRRIPAAHKKQGLFSKTTLVEYSNNMGFFIGHTDDGKVGRNKKSDWNIPAEVFLCDDGTLRSFHPEQGLRPLAISERGESIIPSIGYYTTGVLEDPDDWITDATRSPSWQRTQLWQFTTLALEDRLHEIATGTNYAEQQAHRF